MAVASETREIATVREKDTSSKPGFLQRVADFLHVGHRVNQRHLLGSIFVLAYVSYAMFNNGLGNASSTTRLGLSAAIVERGELTIDDIVNETDDMAKVGEHYYADKAPGMSLMAIPVVYVANFAADLLALPPAFFVGGKATARFQLLHYLAVLFTSVPLTALTVISVYKVASWIGASPGGALFAALAFGFGTPT